MYLSRFGVKNYKCLADVDIPLTPIHVLIGENDAGKTSLMEAFAAFCGSPQELLADCFPAPWSGSELVFHGQTPPRVELAGEWISSNAGGKTPPGDVKYGFTVEFPREGRDCAIVNEWIEHRAQKRNLPTHSRNTTRFRAWKHGQLPQEPTTEDLDVVAAVLKPAHKYSFNAKAMALPATLILRRKFRLDPDGFGLATLLADIALHDPERYQSLRTTFCKLFPQFRSVRVESESALHRDYQSSGLHHSSPGVGSGLHFETRNGETIRAQQASDGAILFLGFLALAHVPDPPTLLLIEEPENGIYPKRLEDVIRLLKEMVGGAAGVRFPQIIFSTHSPYVLSFFEPEEVTFLSRDPKNPQGGVRARPLREAPHIRERLGGGEFYLGELWYNLTEEELFGDS